MSQITVRAHEKLVERVRVAAGRHGVSMNEYVVRVLDAATNPDLSSSESDRVRERLDAAGLLARPERGDSPAPDAGRTARAKRAASGGTPLSDLVRDGRR